MQTQDRIAKIVQGMTVAGITILVSFVGAVVLLATSPTDSGQRGAGHGAVSGAAWLTIVWVVGAVAFSTFRWRATNLWFRIVLAINTMIACLLVAQFWAD